MKTQMHHKYKSHTPGNQSDSHVNFRYLVRGPLQRQCTDGDKCIYFKMGPITFVVEFSDVLKHEQQLKTSEYDMGIPHFSETAVAWHQAETS